MQNEPLKYITRIAEENIEKALNSGKVILVSGARQVGKTTLVKRVLEGRKTVFLNFDLEMDKQRFLAASVLAPSDAMSAFGNPDFLVLDEAQRLPESVRIVKGWYDSGCFVLFFLLSSSSFQLADKAAESMAGRNLKLNLPQLTFREILDAQPWYSAVFKPEQMMEKFAPQVESLLLTCMVFGHYPEAVLTPDKRSYLLNLVSDTLWKDLLQMGLIKTPDVIRRLLTLLAHQTGSEVSVNELSTALGLARPTVERYLELLEQSFVIFRLVAFSTNPRKEISKSRKIYFWDTGIRNALLNEFSMNPLRTDIGALWENWVVAEFARQNLLSGSLRNLYFWRSRSGSEVDLIVRVDESIQAYKIKWGQRRKVGRAFSDLYHVPVRIISRSQPLFRMDED